MRASAAQRELSMTWSAQLPAQLVFLVISRPAEQAAVLLVLREHFQLVPVRHSAHRRLLADILQTAPPVIMCRAQLEPIITRKEISAVHLVHWELSHR